MTTRESPLSAPNRVLCECGCGIEVNPKLGLVRELRAQGLSFPSIGEMIGITGAYAKVLSLKPPRFIKGHSAKVQWGFADCISCGKQFLKRGANHRVCLNRTCASERAKENWAKWEKYDAEVEERRARREGLVKQRRDLRRLLGGQQAFGSQAFQERKLAEVQQEIEALNDELQALVNEQERDARFFQEGKPWMLSLDKQISDDSTLLDFIDHSGNLALGQRFTPDFSDLVCAVVDRRREIDSYA